MSKSADAFRTISEVADWLGVQTHVLRFWESKFTQVKPVKRAGGRRYYRPVDMLLLGGIRKLLHDDGLTIKGVQKVLREKGIAHVSAMSNGLDEVTAAIPAEIPTPQRPPEPLPTEAAASPRFDTSAPEVEAAPPSTAPEIETQDSEESEADTDATIAKFAPGRDLTSSTSTQEAEDAAKNSARPSFTQDAVVMPDTPAQSGTGSAPNSEQTFDRSSEAGAEAITSDFVPPSEPDAAAPSTEPEVSTTPEDIVPSVEDVPQDAVASEPSAPVDSDTPAVGEPEVPNLPDAEVSDTTDPNPEFVFRSAAAPESAPGEAEETPDAAQASSDPEPALPAFMRRTAPLMPPSDNMPPPAQDVTNEPSAAAQAAPEAPSVEPTPEPPKPIIIDVPETPADDDMPAAPALLSKISAATGLAVDAAPLLARLTTLRDKMAAARKE